MGMKVADIGLNPIGKENTVLLHFSGEGYKQEFVSFKVVKGSGLRDVADALVCAYEKVEDMIIEEAKAKKKKAREKAKEGEETQVQD